LDSQSKTVTCLLILRLAVCNYDNFVYISS